LTNLGDEAWLGWRHSSRRSTNLGDEAGLGWGSTNLGDEAWLGWSSSRRDRSTKRSMVGVCVKNPVSVPRRKLFDLERNREEKRANAPLRREGRHMVEVER
jgi:hypothetical protein